MPPEVFLFIRPIPDLYKINILDLSRLSCYYLIHITQ